MAAIIHDLIILLVILLAAAAGAGIYVLIGTIREERKEKRLDDLEDRIVQRAIEELKRRGE